ncbi:MAG: fimbrillin family protein [Duncaniella sp.]|nr:fimbrillin family protein [Muribaculum sp.]MCM1256060.1 fimbrillin family protein [Duncaniella sp.]
MALLTFMVSCNDQDAPPVEPEHPSAGRIAIDFSGSVATKGWGELSSRDASEVKSDNEFYSGDVIGVFAYEIKNYESEPESVTSPNTMYNNALILNTGRQWIYLKESETAYWPGTKGSHVRFLSVYPHSSHSNGQVTVSSYNKNKPATIRIVPDGETDIRIAGPTEPFSKESIITQNNGKVPLVFKHLLQKIVVKFHTDNNSGYSGTVSYIVFNKAKRRFTYTFPGNSTETFDTNDGWDKDYIEGDNSTIKIAADVKLDNEHHNETSHSVAYLPPVDGVLDNMYVIIDGIDYHVDTSSINNAKGGQALNITININTVEKELVCNLTDWIIIENKEETIY